MADAINGSTISGTLTWNPNGTLNHLVIADPFNASDAQTCNYTYDDLVRLASANCGTPWSQTFSYDPFGNITKNGSITWNPGYSPSTNRYTLGGTSYDATGNLLNDTFHTYTWNADGRPVTVDAITLTYDAFGRIVERNNGGVYNQYVYDAAGNKLATMTGQTLTKGIVPLPGGIQATYDPTNSGTVFLTGWAAIDLVPPTTEPMPSATPLRPLGRDIPMAATRRIISRLPERLTVPSVTNTIFPHVHCRPARGVGYRLILADWPQSIQVIRRPGTDTDMFATILLPS
ncbi:MAG TPA: hypothetical protein VKM56_09125 [Verrucomicrobiae bacterium]|nr:hypothetical protein [Verrucomicrobiae bacterium]